MGLKDFHNKFKALAKQVQKTHKTKLKDRQTNSRYLQDKFRVFTKADLKTN